MATGYSGGRPGEQDAEWAMSDSTLSRVPTQSRSRAKVDRSLAVAASLLESEGVDAITLTRVAKEADVSVGALYQYLPDREAIVNALSARYHARHELLLDTLVAQLSGPTEVDPVDPVASVVGAFARLYREQSGTRALRAGLQSTAQTGATRAHKERMVAKVHTLLGALHLTGTGSSDRVARTVFFAADALMHEAFSADDDGDPVLLAELEVLLRSYLGAH